MRYCIQCTDASTGNRGTFGYDTAHYKATKTFKAITPIFGCLAEFYPWAKTKGIELDHTFTGKEIK